MVNQDPGPKGTWPRWAGYFAVAFSVVLLGWTVFFFVQTAPRLTYHYALDPCEPYSLNRTMRMARGLPLYKDVHSPPFVLANYPPVYEYLLTWTIDPHSPSYAPGRILSYGAQILILLLLMGWIYHRTGSWMWAFWGMAFTLFARSTWEWTALYRVDMLALLWNLVGVVLAFHGPKKWGKWAAIPFFLLAGYTKQVFIAAPLAVFWWQWWKSGKREALSFLAVYALSGVAIFAAGSALTGGGFYYHTVHFNFTPVDGGRTVDMSLRPLGKSFGVWAVIALVGWWRWRRGEWEWRPIWGYAVLTYTLVVLTGGKLGSSWNYFLELVVVMAVLLGDSLAYLVETGTNRLWKVVAFFLVAQVVFGAMTLPEKDEKIWHGARQMEEVKEMLDQFLKKHPGPILCDNVDGETVLPPADVVVLSGRLLELNLHYFLMMKGGLWESTPLVEAVQNKRYTLVILTRPLKESDQSPRWQALRENYHLSHQIAHFFIYKPHM